MIKKFDIDIKRIKGVSPKAIHTVYFGGERIRRVEIWYDSVGEPHTARVVYSEDKK